VLSDVRLRGSSGLDLCRQLLERDPSRRIVLLSAYDDEQYLFQALRAGAAGYLLKRVTGAELVAHLERVVDGETVVDPTMAGRAAASAARLQRGEFWAGAHVGLTHRESEVLVLAVAGLSNRAIAGRLVLGEETVKSHLRSIYRKLEVNDRAGAVAVALREGIVS
jgi:DNA-binding NarL/FixJ family response regulator